MDELEPGESNSGHYRFKNIDKVLQSLVDAHRRHGDPVFSEAADNSKFVPIGVSFDSNKADDVLLQLAMLKTTDLKGAKNSQNCHVVGAGPGDDSAVSFKVNYPEYVAAINKKGTAFFH